MLDRITATAEEVANTTVFTHRHAYVLGNIKQVDVLTRDPAAAGCLVVSAGVVMTGKAINPGFVTEVKGSDVSHTVTGVTAGASIFVRCYRRAVVVQRIAFAALVNLAVNFLFSAPGPVTGFHKIGCLILVAFQALLCDLRTCC